MGFGLSSAAKTDLVKLLLAEFALVFANDWFILPFAASVGSLIETQGIVVTDNFGFNTLIEPTALRHDAMGLAGQWGMWTLSTRGAIPAAKPAADPRFLLVPAVARSLESKPVDEVAFVRDEMANLVWAIESVIPDPLGGGRDARGAAKLLREAIRQAYPEPAAGHGALGGVALAYVAYELMGSVPENWCRWCQCVCRARRLRQPSCKAPCRACRSCCRRWMPTANLCCNTTSCCPAAACWRATRWRSRCWSTKKKSCARAPSFSAAFSKRAGRVAVRCPGPGDKSSTAGVKVPAASRSIRQRL